MLENFALLSIVLVSAMVFMGVGRLVLAHTRMADAGSPLEAMMAGLGVWYLWFLGFQGLIGASLPVVWWIFIASALALLLVLTKTHRFDGESKMFWPVMVVGLILTGPALLTLTDAYPHLWSELAVYMKNADHILRLGGLPNPTEVKEFDIFAIGTPAAAIVANLPDIVMRGSFSGAMFAVLNLVVLVAAGAQMMRIAGFKAGWHNLLLVSVVGLVAVWQLNPVFNPNLDFAGCPDLLVAAALFAAAAPLLKNTPMPYGLGVLPNALALGLLVGLVPSGLGLFEVVLLLWVLRTLFEERALSLNDFLGWALLALVPVVSQFIWNAFLVRSGFAPAAPVDLASIFGQSLAPGLVALGHVLAGNIFACLLFAVVMGLGLFKLLAIRGGRSLRVFLVDEASITYPFLISAIYLLLLGPVQPAADHVLGLGAVHNLQHVQFILLVPVWVLLAGWVRDNAPATGFLGRNPGVAAPVCALLFAGLMVARSPQLVPPMPAPLDHTFRVAETMRIQNMVPWGDKLGVLDSLNTRGYYAVAMGFGLRHYAPVRPVLGLFTAANGNFDRFLDGLLHHGYKYLWVHSMDSNINNMIGGRLNPNDSYLYKVTENGLVPVASFPHPGYQTATLPPMAVVN